jgi:hypothetical protein
MDHNEIDTRGTGNEKLFSLEEIKVRLEILYERSSKHVAPDVLDDCPALMVIRDVIGIVQQAIDGDTSVLDAMLEERRK